MRNARHLPRSGSSILRHMRRRTPFDRISTRWKGDGILTLTLSPSDYEAVRNLYARYSFAVDGGRFDELASCFTEDAVMTLSAGGTFRGGSTIADLARRLKRRPRHLISNMCIDFENPFRGTSRAYFTLLNPTTGDVAAFGLYEDTLVRNLETGAWNWAERHVIYQGPHDADLAGVGGDVTE